MVEDKKPSTNEINTYFLINELFGGDGAKALSVARRYPSAKFTLTPKSIERYMILECIVDKGMPDEDIIKHFKDIGFEINTYRVKRLRKEVEDGKREF
jgi:hypothetical protein